jgi:hypothetical protein
VHDGILIEQVDGGHETLLEFMLGGDADVGRTVPASLEK